MTHDLTNKSAYKGKRILFSAYTANGAWKKLSCNRKQGRVSKYITAEGDVSRCAAPAAANFIDFLAIKLANVQKDLL
jgi:hypothetical protein